MNGPVEIGEQIDAIAAIGERFADSRGHGGVEIDGSRFAFVSDACRNRAGPGYNSWRVDPAFLLGISAFAAAVRLGGTAVRAIGPIVAGEENERVVFEIVFL